MKKIVTLSKIEICDVLGRVLIEKDLTTSQTEINISTLSNGIYFVKTMLSNGTLKTNKIVKE